LLAVSVVLVFGSYISRRIAAAKEAV